MATAPRSDITNTIVKKLKLFYPSIVAHHSTIYLKMSFLAQRLVEAFGILSYQWSSLPLSLTRDSCRGKTYIVTGANIGLGYECAKHLVQLGAHRVILAVRSPTRGQAALEALEKETGIRDVAECWLLDLASHQSTVAFAERVKGQLERVDAIVENAASATAEWSIAEGLESNMTVNVVGTLFLAVLLMPYLEQCAMKFNIQPRVSIVISGLGFSRRADLAKIDRANILKDVSDDKKWSIVGTERYVGCRERLKLRLTNHTGTLSRSSYRYSPSEPWRRARIPLARASSST
jgi:hypothetical protein